MTDEFDFKIGLVAFLELQILHCLDQIAPCCVHIALCHCGVARLNSCKDVLCSLQCVLEVFFHCIYNTVCARAFSKLDRVFQNCCGNFFARSRIYCIFLK